MAKGNLNSILYVDSANQLVHYYGLGPTGQIITDEIKIAQAAFTPEYYKFFTSAVSAFSQKHCNQAMGQAIIILSDNCVFSNLANFPVLAGPELNNSINAYIKTLYRNSHQLKIVNYRANITKQLISMFFCGVRADIITGLRQACADASVAVNTVSYATSSIASALAELAPNLYRGTTYMFMDVKEEVTKIILSSKGKAVGSFELPFGYSQIPATKHIAEDVLLYSPAAELLVINAREKAKQKELTLAGQANVNTNEEENDEENAFVGSDSLAPTKQLDTNAIKVLPKKTARKLPKFMLRDVPEDDDHKVYENFRTFIKWALDIIKNNKDINTLDPIKNVYINLPSEYDFLFDIINEEAEENGVKFLSADLSKQKEDITKNLEMYGGNFVKTNKLSTIF